MVTDHDPLNEPRFAYHSRKDGAVNITFHGKVVTTLKGREADRFLARVTDALPRQQQLVMAKATGHFKHGNEQLAKAKRKR